MLSPSVTVAINILYNFYVPPVTNTRQSSLHIHYNDQLRSRRRATAGPILGTDSHTEIQQQEIGIDSNPQLKWTWAMHQSVHRGI